MYKRRTLLRTLSNGVFTKTRSFNPEHLYSTKHIDYSAFDEVLVVCTDNEPTRQYEIFIDDLVRELTIPLVISGNINSLNDARKFFDLGADRLILNRSLWTNSKLTRQLANIYGKQAVIASFDFIKEKSISSFNWETKEKRISFLPEDFLEITDFIGEIFLQDVNHDGRVIGSDINAIKEIQKFLPPELPIHIGSCGLVSWDQYAELLELDYVDAVSVNNVHHMSIKACKTLREYCKMKNLNIRML